jgi:hypothetical protein
MHLLVAAIVKNRKHPAMSRIMDTFSGPLSAYQRPPK